MKSYKSVALKYARDVVNGKKIAGKQVVEACQRFLDDLKRDDLELRTHEPDAVIGLIQGLMVHKQGEDISGKPLAGTPLLLQPWQVFVIYDLIGFYWKGTDERRFKEAFIMVPRKSGKTLLAAGLAWGLALLERKSGSSIYITAASLKQAMQSFEDILYTIRSKGMDNQFLCKTQRRKRGT